MEYMESKMQDYIENGISEADRCYTRIAELEEQNSALAAQVEALRHACWVHIRTGTGGENLIEALESTPQHHLRQVRADAGRDGFIAGADDAWHYTVGTKAPNNMTVYLANKYHASILAGKE